MAILGIDEVGRGPLAGPLVVGAVILPDHPQPWFSELRDSKRLTAKKRSALNELILREAATGLGWVTVTELDQLGISQALCLATKRAVQAVKSTRTAFSQIIIDGKVNFLTNTPFAKYVSTIVKADNLIKEVSAASIIAKVARDNYMIDLSTSYPNYHFDKHLGYGTVQHLKAIYQYGLCPEHRKSFEPCKTLSGFNSASQSKTASCRTTTAIGRQAEDVVANYLTKHGHQIVARNHKTYFYEIDIISVCQAQIFFTEVKYRHNATHGNGLEAITPKKLDQMSYAATSYLRFNPAYRHYQPTLAVASVEGDNFNIKEWIPLS